MEIASSIASPIHFVEEHLDEPRLLDEMGMNRLERDETVEPAR